MNDVGGQVPPTGTDPSMGPPRGGAASRSRGCLRSVGTIGLIVAGLGVLAFVWLWITLQQAFPAPKSVPAPVAWTSEEVVLSDDRSVAHGRLTLTASAAPRTGLRVGLNAGVPSTAATARPSGSTLAGPSESTAPAALLSGAHVRLTATAASGAPQSCIAPCELQLPSAFECESGTCTTVFDVTVELMADGAGIGRAVTLDVAGGATAPLDKGLPDGLVVDLEVDGAIVPGGS